MIRYLGSSFVTYYAPDPWRPARLGRIEGDTVQGSKKILGGDATVPLLLG